MQQMLENIFELKKYNTTVMTECMAGLVTFCSIAYIMFFMPVLLTMAGNPDNPFPTDGIFLAVVLSSFLSTFLMGIYANVPYMLASGIGMGSFFTFTVCGIMGFTWQEALAMVFICSVISMVLTLSNVRKMLIAAIPESIQISIGVGIGIYIAFIGLNSAGFFQYILSPGTYITLSDGTVKGIGGVLALASFNNMTLLLSLAGMVILYVMLLKNIKFAIMKAMIVSAALGIAVGYVDLSSITFNTASLQQSFHNLWYTFGSAFGSKGMGSLLADSSRYMDIFVLIFAFSLTDIFDTLGMFMGTGRQTGIFSAEDMEAIKKPGRSNTRMERALMVDMVGTCMGSILGASNVTTFVESNAGVQCGGRTGLTAVVASLLMLSCVILSPIVKIVTVAVTAPVMIFVGISMLAASNDINWRNIESAVPAFGATLMMTFCNSISTGIACCYISYCFTMVIQGKGREVHPILWICSGLFFLNYVIQALI